jgi:putative PEP-CTERM system TPR-repeat lipoprotein
MFKLRVLHHLLLCAALLLAGCGKAPEASYAAAQAYLEKGDRASAIVELKNVLQSEPDLAEARYLLGRSLLETGDPVAAVVELRKAQNLNFPDDQVVPLLARALLESGEPRKVLELDREAVLTRSESIARLKTAAALAHAAEGDLPRAGAAVADALRADPEHAPALLYRARSLAGKRDYAEATKLVDSVLERDPADADALNLRGDLLQFGSGDVAGAMDQYRKALAAKPDSVDAHSALITQMLAQNDLKSAKTQLEALEAVRRRHPRTLYFKARLASLEGDTKLATELTQDLLNVMPANLQILQLAGIVALQRGDLLQAEQNFAKIVQAAPNLAGARKALARVYLSAGEYRKAIETLKPILAAPAPDAETLTMAGQALLSTGDARQAEELLSRAVKLKPNDAQQRTTLAQARLARGELSGLEDLDKIAGTDPGVTADMALISARITRRDFAGALNAVERLGKKQPGQPLPPHLRGQILVMQGDWAAARASYGQALAVNAKYFPSIEGLAALDLREKKPEQARARFDALLKEDPRNSRAILALARLDESAGKPSAEVAARIGEAVAASPSDPALRKQLIDYLLAKGDAKGALTAAQAAIIALPNHPAALELLARAQAASGDTHQAALTYGQLSSLLPTSPDPHLGLARARVAAKDYARALESVNKALAIAPDDTEATELAVNLFIRAGRQDEAAALARSLQQRMPDSVIGYGLLGDVEMSRRNYAAAAAAYESVLKRKQATPAAIRLHRALFAGGRSAQAQAMADAWLQERPRDAQFLFYLGSAALGAKDFGTAEARFAEVVKLQPDNAWALNNLAWTMHRQGKRGGLAHSERANQLLPNTPALMDTWAALLADDGNLRQALELQQRAVTLAPDAPGMRLNLARIYVVTGDKAAARAELERLQELGPKFGDQQAVRDLLAKL